MCFFSENLKGVLLMEFANTPCTKYLECGVFLELIFRKIRHMICNYKHMAPVNVNILETWRTSGDSVTEASVECTRSFAELYSISGFTRFRLVGFINNLSSTIFFKSFSKSSNFDKLPTVITI